jgi:hypothetical protein
VTVTGRDAARHELGDLILALAGLLVAIAVAMAAALEGPVVLLGLALALVLAVCAYRPVAGTYLYLATLPFIAGFERGTIPLLRPNEALLLLVIGGALLGAYFRHLAGTPVRLRFRPAVDAPLAAFVLLCTAWPLASLLLRGEVPREDELAALLPAGKLAAVFLLVRMTVLDQRQLVRVMRIIVWSASGIALIAIAQTLRVPQVIDFLGTYMPAEQSSEIAARGSTTLSSSIATGDVIAIGLILVITCAVRGLLGRTERLVAGLVLAAGVLAAGQFSTWIAALVGGALILHQYPQLRRQAVRFLPVAGVALLVGAPAFIARLQSFGEGYGVPRSWLGRWDNLTTFYVPSLFDDGAFLIGVSPESVLPAPETWRELIYLESGYLHLLWVGGLPLLAGFVWLSIAVLRRCADLAGRPDALGACASTLQIAWWMVIILSVIDPHLFLRGTGDLLFALLAIVSGPLDRAPAAPGTDDLHSRALRPRGRAP